MIVVLQCAGTKREGAGKLQTESGKPVLFVAKPQLAVQTPEELLAHPDDASDFGRTWRDLLISYNASDANPLKLCRAFELYTPPAAPSIYQQLVHRLGFDNVYILSAGWGLIRSDFLTPDYDITFAREVLKKAPWKHRPGSEFRDCRQMPDDIEDHVVFLGSKSYVGLFCSLTRSVRAPKAVYYNSSIPPKAVGCSVVRFESDNRRTWHYECAAELLRRSGEA